MIYLDNAATTYPKPDIVYDTANYAMRELAVNIGRGSFDIASKAMNILDETRHLMAKLVKVQYVNNVIITPSATIAANEIINGLKWDADTTVYVSPFEHNAIARPLNAISQKYGIEIKVLPYDPITYSIDLEKTCIEFSSHEPDYVFVNHMSNVTGVVNPIRTIFEMAKKYGAITIADGSQSLGLINIDMNTDNVDYLIFAGHKNLYSLFGVGGFISRNEPNLEPSIFGGTGSDSLSLEMGHLSPTRYEPASHNISAISSLNAALKWINEITINKLYEHKKCLSDYLYEELKKNGCKVYAPQELKNQVGIVSFNVDGYSPNEIGDILNMDYDIAVRTGYHCAPYIHSRIGSIDTHGTVRASISFFNSIEDIDNLIAAIREI